MHERLPLAPVAVDDPDAKEIRLKERVEGARRGLVKYLGYYVDYDSYSVKATVTARDGMQTTFVVPKGEGLNARIFANAKGRLLSGFGVDTASYEYMSVIRESVADWANAEDYDRALKGQPPLWTGRIRMQDDASDC